MSETYFTISLNSANNTIDDVVLPEGLKQTYIDVFAILTQNPFAVDESITRFQEYYLTQIPSSAAANVASDATLAALSQMSVDNNVIQLDMDGNLIISNHQPVFATTKEESKDILGSVEKLSANEILIADNKRAIIVDVLTQQVKWEYNSDRYVVDAHIILQDNVTIKINNSDYVSEDIIVNKGQTVIWENELSTPIVIYSGDISDVDITVDFDGDLYGDVFKSITLNQGDRWAYKFDEEAEISWFSYPNNYVGKIVVSDYKISSANQYIILESDGKESPFTGRVVKVNCWGDILWSFGGNGFMVLPRDARSMLENKVIISV